MADPAAGGARQRPGFRSDINGLRAVAVLSVIAFHFRTGLLPGGFSGVDVFFVISGYLMTGIITQRIDAGTFSLGNFYLDRARRIVPALAVLILAVIVCGWFVTLPTEYLALGKHAAASALFVSNMMYWREAGYFDATADAKWLLHTWSLSVEWQFYVLFPLLVMLFCRFVGRARLWIGLAGGAAISFAVMCWLAVYAPTAAFFLLPPRAWEMLLGGIVYLAPALSGRPARLAQIAGLVAIIASARFASQAAWPGLPTLLPTLGAALVILAGKRDSILTGNPVLKRIGLVSYSLYLWHWPVVVLLALYGMLDDWRYIALGIAVSYLMAELSYRHVEPLAARLRAARVAPGARFTQDWRWHGLFLAISVSVAAAGAAVWLKRGVPSRFPAAVIQVEADATPGGPYSARCFSISGPVSTPCVIGPARGPVAGTLLGDSHAEASASAVVAALGGSRRLAFNAYAACPPLLDARITNPESRCAEYIARYLEPQTRPRRTPVVLIARWSGYVGNDQIRIGQSEAAPDVAALAGAIKRTSCALAAGGPTYLLLPTPEFPFNVAPTLQRALWADENAAEITQPLAEHLAKNRQLIAAFHAAERECGVHLLDPLPILCPAGTCTGSRDHRAIIRDTDHISEHGNKLLVPLFRSVVWAN